MKSLASVNPEDLYSYIKSVRGFRKKADWLVKIAQALANHKDIPLTIEELTKLPGIGRKSANVIIREAGGPPTGYFYRFARFTGCAANRYYKRRKT